MNGVAILRAVAAILDAAPVFLDLWNGMEQLIKARRADREISDEELGEAIAAADAQVDRLGP